MSGSSGSSLWRSFSDFVDTQVAAVQGTINRLLNTAAGSMTLALAQADTSVALFLQNGIITVLNLGRSATCEGDDLDSFYAQFNFPRLGTLPASGQVTMARYTPTLPVSVPVGAIVSTGPGGVQFQVVESTTNANWDPTVTSGGVTVGGYTMNAATASMSVPVQSLNSGTGGNIIAGAINTFLQPIPYIDTVTNPLAFTNGLPQETDPAYQSRFVFYINSRSLGVEAAIETAILSTRQGLSYDIVGNAMPGQAAGTTPGTYSVYIDDGTGATPSSTVAQVYAAIDAVNGFTIEFYVLAATPIVATVSEEITVAAGYVFANVQSLVVNALEAYGQTLGVGEPFPYSRIPQVSYDASNGVVNVTNITLNGAVVDLACGIGQVIQVVSPVVNLE